MRGVSFARLRLSHAFIFVCAIFVSVRSESADVTFPGYAPGINYHAIGARIGDFAWGAASDLGIGFLTYGPYTTRFENGVYEAKFRLSVDDNTADDLVVAYVDVYDNLADKELARREIHRKEFSGAHLPQDVRLSFVTIGGNKLEFRVFVFGKAYVAHESTTVRRMSAFENTILTSIHDAVPNRRASPERSSVQIAHSEFRGEMPAGNYTARFSLRVDDNSKDNSTVATLDVHNSTTDSVLSKIDLSRKEFLLAGAAQTFELPFEYDGTGKLEYRVHEYSAARLQHISTTVVTALALSYEGTDAALRHQMGSANNGSWLAKRSDGPGYLTFGPYTRGVPPGVATATFKLRIDDSRQGNDVVALLDVYDATSGKVLTRRSIMRGDFTSSASPQDFDLVFEVAEAAALEFRIFSNGVAKLEHLSTTINPDRLTLAALWNLQAHWEFRKRDIFTSRGIQDYATSSIVSLDGIWYAFNREPVTNIDTAEFKSCTQRHSPPLQIVVRSSTDRAVTWSEPVVIATPSSSPSSPDYCEIADGGAYFDAETDVWHYLAQCVNPPSDWSMCHYTRAGLSPMGTFVADPKNPVIVGGQLWSKICEGEAKACPTTMKDEGTPQILSKSSEGYFYVTFHGANYGSIVTGARGVARTADFINWQVSGGDLPNDAMLTSRDCKDWNAGWAPGGCIGEGDARILRSNGEYYVLTEAADKSLNCEPGQRWVFGLLRNFKLGASGSWQNYSENPIMVNDNISPVGCALQYMNLVRDRGELYLEFSLYSPDYPFPNYIYQLVDGAPDMPAIRVK
jgi:hypothetical protein